MNTPNATPAYVLDEAGTFPGRVNHDLVELSQPDAERRGPASQADPGARGWTVSVRARNILLRWEEYLPLFRKVSPKGAAAQVAQRGAGT